LTSSRAQQAPIVFFSMATLSGENVSRNLEFFFSRNRLNVAISRASVSLILFAHPASLKPAIRLKRWSSSMRSAASPNTPSEKLFSFLKP
jgi:superfamily I DNA and/or RNA helicase